MAASLTLLPTPRQVRPTEGVHSIQAGRYIWLTGESPAALLRTGKLLKASLAEAGRHLELTAARGDDLSRLAVVLAVDPAQVPQPEGYRITIRPDQIYIVGHDPAGAFYAVMTLKQIVQQAAASGELPCLHIEDWPDFAHRGVLLDISRDKVPTMETLYMLVDMLAEWKINQFQLYTEHTFAYRNHEEVWANASPMTGGEVMALDAYCRERFIELVPNQNSFGHMTRWLIHPRYRSLAETTGRFQFPWGGWSEEPFSLCPLEPGSLDLLRGMYTELLPHFSSRQFNVGCDETFDLGQGKSKQACEERGVGRVYLDFLLEIHDLVQRQGRTMQFWGDIILHHPELISELPRDVIALEWGYEADHPFAADTEKFAQAGVPFYVCPGTSSWRTIAGRTENALGNLWSASENGLAQSAIGYLNTDWGDDGHWQHFPISMLGFAYGAAVSWAAKENQELDLQDALDLYAFQDAAGVMGKLAYDLGNVYKQPGLLLHNSSALFVLLRTYERSIGEGRAAGMTVENLEATLASIDSIMSSLSKAQMERPDALWIAEEFRNTADLLRHACRLGIARLQAQGDELAGVPKQTRNTLADELTPIITEYKRLWLARNRPGGLVDSAGRLERLLAAYQAD